ncbi:hypothetical protein V5O48_011623 [Marasmius crinis-equi]|uniref:Zn(2)-C6 fungal-type domain-containing protein n=1 Tax=Marasmius crinis-equi TaxID=585013 RepID=A0ABR3F5C3_9AGAR
MLSQPKVQVLTQEKDKENENDSLKQLEDYGESEVEVEVESDSDADAGTVTITSSLKQEFARFYNVHGTNEERRKWKEDNRSLKCTNCASSKLPCTAKPDLKIRCSECHTSVPCSKMEVFRRDLMMPKLGIREVEVWETLNRGYLREKAKGKGKERFGSEDDEKDELELDGEEEEEEGNKNASVRSRNDAGGSPTKKVYSPRKVEVVIQTRKKRDREEEKNNTKKMATNSGFTILSKTSPEKTREQKRQRRPNEKAQAVERNKNKNMSKVATLSSSRAALNPNTDSATRFSLMPSPTSTLNQNVVSTLNTSRLALPALTPPLRTPSSALQLTSSVPRVPPPTPAGNDLEPDLRLSVIKRQLEDLCSDFRYGRIDVQSALGRFDEVAARIGRCANVVSG